MTRTPTDLMLAYGVTHRMATQLLNHQQEFYDAVRFFGPMFCRYDRASRRWLLFERPASRAWILTHYRHRR